MNSETGEIREFKAGELKDKSGNWLAIPSDQASQRTLRGFNRAQRRRYGRLIRQGQDMHSAIAAVSS